MKRRVILLAWTVTCMSALSGPAVDSAREILDGPLRARTMHKLGVTNCELYQLSLPSHDDLERSRSNNLEVQVSIPMAGHQRELVLRPHSLRAPNFRLLVQRADGIHQETPPPPHTWRGYIQGESTSVVVASLSDTRITGTVRDAAGQLWVIQPLTSSISNALPGAHAIFRPQDELPTSIRCGAEDFFPDETNGSMKTTLQSNVLELATPTPSPSPPPSSTTYYFARIGYDADFRFYNSSEGGNGTVQGTLNTIEDHLNQVDHIFTRDVQIGYELTVVVVRTIDAPYIPTGDAGNLKIQLQAEWNNNLYSICPVSGVTTVIHLLTGMALNVGGTSFGTGSTPGNIGPICYLPAYAYSLSSDRIDADTYDRRINLNAHELGHNWGATHCDSIFPWDGCLDDNTPPLVGIMASTPPPWPSNFGDHSKSEIIAHRNAYSGCLDVGWVFVNASATSPFLGTAEHPFQTFLQGVQAVQPGRTVAVHSGHYNEQMVLSTPMKLRLYGDPGIYLDPAPNPGPPAVGPAIIGR